MTTYDTDADIVHAVEAGAAGYLLKDIPRTQLIGHVREVLTGFRSGDSKPPGGR